MPARPHCQMIQIALLIKIIWKKIIKVKIKSIKKIKLKILNQAYIKYKMNNQILLVNNKKKCLNKMIIKIKSL